MSMNACPAFKDLIIVDCTASELENLTYIGNFYYPGFLLFKHPLTSNLYIVDQHAADERCRLERLSLKELPGIGYKELQSWACKGAVKLTEETSEEFRNGLVKRLFKCREPMICAHGRPTIIKIASALDFI
jgi:DNA mismatch repair ATPase MutL